MKARAWVEGLIDGTKPMIYIFHKIEPNFPKMVEVNSIYSDGNINYYDYPIKRIDTKNNWIFKILFHTGYRDFYSGDIIELWQDLDRSWSAGRGVVKWEEDGMFGPGYVIRDISDNGLRLFCNWKKYEKIGNIYENPELIE